MQFVVNLVKYPKSFNYVGSDGNTYLMPAGVTHNSNNFNDTQVIQWILGEFIEITGFRVNKAKYPSGFPYTDPSGNTTTMLVGTTYYGKNYDKATMGAWFKNKSIV
ncbi:MAG: hypothetical protein NTW84_07135 [Methanothrix sp.]|jgi:hypothetical protein|nr:hypothetical protein [Methanothrix sp.]